MTFQDSGFWQKNGLAFNSSNTIRSVIRSKNYLSERQAVGCGFCFFFKYAKNSASQRLKSLVLVKWEIWASVVSQNQKKRFKLLKCFIYKFQNNKKKKPHNQLFIWKHLFQGKFKYNDLKKPFKHRKKHIGLIRAVKLQLNYYVFSASIPFLLSPKKPKTFLYVANKYSAIICSVLLGSAREH